MPLVAGMPGLSPKGCMGDASAGKCHFAGCDPQIDRHHGDRCQNPHGYEENVVSRTYPSRLQQQFGYECRAEGAGSDLPRPSPQRGRFLVGRCPEFDCPPA
jgi:hypothetical protein